MCTPVSTTTDFPRPIPGRECGSCSMCCKVYNVPEINKPAGTWCTHCKPGRGCGIHDALPSQCATFNCMWRIREELPPHWKPDQAKMVISVDPASGYIIVQVDPSMPSAWRRQPYYDQLRLWAKRYLDSGAYVLVGVNYDVTLILPDQDIPLGQMKYHDRIRLLRNGNSYQAIIVPGAVPTSP